MFRSFASRWLRSGVAGFAIRKLKRRSQLARKLTLEQLERRITPATINYNALTSQLTYTADVGVADVVTVTTPTASSVRIVVGGGDTITLTGDVGAGFTLSGGNTQLDIDTAVAPLLDSTFNLGDLGDTFTLTLAPGTTGVTNVTINGEGGNDVFNVRGTAAGTTTTIVGGDGNDDFNVSSDAPTNAGDLNGLDGVLRLAPGGGADLVNISERGNATADNVTVNSGIAPGFIQGTVGGGWRVDFPTADAFLRGINLALGSAADTVQVQTIFERTTIDGGGGGDTYNVIAPYNKTGAFLGIHPVIGGGLILADSGTTGIDQYNIDVDGSPVTVNTGGPGTLTYQVTTPASGLITQNDGDNVYAFALQNLADDSLTLIVNGASVADGAPDTTTLSVTGGGTLLRVQVNTFLNADFELVKLASLAVNGTGDDDTLVVDFTNGAPYPATGLTFHADGGNDTLNLTTAGATTIQLTARGAGGDGFDGNNGGAISFTNVNAVLAGNATNELRGINEDATWNVTTANGGQYQVGANSLAFTNFANLTGGTGVDQFVLAAGGSVTGTLDGGGGSDRLSGANAANVWTLTGANAGNLNGILFVNMENLVGGDSTDQFVFLAGGSVAGTINGGGGTNGLDYSASAVAVAVNLGLGSTGLGGTLEGGQEVPPQDTTANGTVTITNYNVTTKTFDISVTVTDLDPLLVTGFHIHRAPVGVNGPIIVDFIPGGVPLAPLVPSGTGFTFNATNVPLGALHEAAFLGGITYVNIHTAAAPGGLIRGQLFTNGNVNLAVGTATNTGGVTNIQNVVGSPFGDSLVGSFAVNNLNGLGGDDVLVGGPGADVMRGGSGDDVLVWSNGDGSDVIDGEDGADLVNVNGSVDNGDVFTVSAGPNGRVDFRRTNLGPFGLDIGTTETLTVNGIGGDDRFQVNDLTNVADLSRVNLNGFAGNDEVTGPNLDTNWTIDGRNRGSFTAVALPGILGNFTGMEDLVGGSQADTFSFTDAGLVGNIDGGDGTDKLDYSALTTASNTNLQTEKSTGIDPGGFVNMECVTGSATMGGTLTGRDVANVWTIDGANQGDVGGFEFRNITNLVGGGNTDRFFFANDTASVAGQVNGGLGVDTLDYSSDLFTGPVLTNLQTATTTGTGGFASIERLIGSRHADDTLVGRDAAALWSLEGTGTGTVSYGTGADDTVSFGALPGGNNQRVAGTGYENLTGGSQRDVFRFRRGGSVPGDVHGGTGDNWLDFHFLTTPIDVDLRGVSPVRVRGPRGPQLIGGVVNVDNVLGNATGGDKIVGNGRANILVTFGRGNYQNGLGGNDVMIGGRLLQRFIPGTRVPDNRNNVLVGGAGNDLIIPGATIYDTSFGALESIRNEWQNARPGFFDATVINLFTGRGQTNGNSLRLNVTVFVQSVGPGVVPNARKFFGFEQTQVIGGTGEFNGVRGGDAEFDFVFAGFAAIIHDIGLTEVWDRFDRFYK